MHHHLIWFRGDLRCGDNPALDQALHGADRVSALYLQTPQQDRQHHRGPRQQAFIQANLQALQEQLLRLGIELHRLQAPDYTGAPAAIASLVEEQQVSQVFANREPGVNEERRDHAVARAIAAPLKRFNGDCVLKYGSVLSGKGEMFRVFTPFRTAWLNIIRQRGYTCLAAPDDGATPDQGDRPAEKEQAFADWPAGEQTALARLDQFLQDGLEDYAEQRDFPGVAGTSGLSPYLAIGALSPRQCLQALQDHLGYLPMSPGETGFAWLNELVWREFYRHLMVAFPRVSMDRSFKPDMDALKWVDNSAHFDAWCNGMTGYPVVDAAMRCLNQTGWMHNRLRMVVASFLTKDLQIDWRQGEHYFMQQLLDADFASNNGGWQWAAGTGADAAPYFRIFNPTSQGEKFDRDGDFIRQWVPELASVPSKQLHQPQTWLDTHQPDHAYPPPVVDHALARKQTLARYQRLKEQA